MNPIVQVPVKILIGKDFHPGKKELDYFYDKWVTQGKKMPFTGEFNTPASDSPSRLLTTDPSQISHCITDIHMNTFDPQKSTVMVSVRFSGPRGNEAADEFIANNIRFVARSVKVKDPDTGKSVDRLITLDCMHRPKDAPKKTLKPLKRK